jgi:hypothetical protein
MPFCFNHYLATNGKIFAPHRFPHKSNIYRLVTAVMPVTRESKPKGVSDTYEEC